MTSAIRELDGPLRELFERIDPVADLSRPDLPLIAKALMSLAADHDYLAPAIADLADTTGRASLYVPERGPRLFLVHRREGEMSAVHDHQVWVALAPVVGVESHRRWRPVDTADRDRIEVTNERAVEPAKVVTLLPPDDIHDHGHRLGVGDAAYVLILLGDDQVRYRRSEWDPETGRRRTLEPGDPGRWLASEPFTGPATERG
jgi:predicted metal-dependent enzyme (double-stranded beta helix superfamily)